MTDRTRHEAASLLQPNRRLRPPPRGVAPVDVRAKIAADPSGWQLTFTGRAVFSYALDPADIDPADVAHHLALQNRFAGATREPYPVAQHLVLCSWHAEARAREEGLSPLDILRVALAALLHDGGEYVCVDSPRPIKRRLQPAYDLIETAAHAAVSEAFGLDPAYLGHPLVLEADDAVLAAEFRDLMPTPPVPIQGLPTPYPEPVTPWGWERAETAFLARLSALTLRLRAAEGE